MVWGIRLLFLAAALFGAVSAVRRPPGSFFRRWDLRPPTPRRDAGEVIRGWMDQKLDHYDPTSNVTWKQLYFASNTYYKPGGPAFLFISGEGPASASWVQGGQMVDLAEAHGAIAFELEHRYYGDSHPTPDLSTKNLRFLTSEQALADLAYFIQLMNKQFELEDTKWIVFGGSYAGNLAAWMRLKYPHLVHAAVASSAPVLAQTDFTGYFEVVGSVMNASSTQCYDDVKNATQELNKLLQTEEGVQKVTKLFNLCKPIDTNIKNDVYYLQSSYAGMFASTVQYNSYERDDIGALCKEVTDPERGATPLERYVRVNVINTNECLNISFNDIKEFYGNVSWDGYSLLRAWMYQTCTEYGYYQTTDSPNQPFSDGFPLQFYIDQCTVLYGEEFNKNLVDMSVERTNILYGGQHPEVTNVVFVNGGADPWHVLGVLQDLSPSAQAVIIDGFSHCGDMYGIESDEPPQLKKAHEKIAALVKDWLAQ
ncbi:putative serine protease K12H4.7 [Anabrus simplex]|uniref:putative serine protease K12H4.7 n=1 Tax=Anabrus simplex TaxID=316456 RepID=UPI0035A281C1